MVVQTQGFYCVNHKQNKLFDIVNECVNRILTWGLLYECPSVKLSSNAPVELHIIGSNCIVDFYNIDNYGEYGYCGTALAGMYSVQLVEVSAIEYNNPIHHCVKYPGIGFGYLTSGKKTFFGFDYKQFQNSIVQNIGSQIR